MWFHFGEEKNCFRGTDGQRSERQDEQLEPLRRVYHETLCNRGWCLLCLRLGAIISWSVGCRFASGSRSSTRCREQRRWRRLDYANCSQLRGANFPVSTFRPCIHFTCLRQSLRLVLPAAETSSLAGAAGAAHSAWFIPLWPRVITALRVNSVAGASVRLSAATRCTEQGTVLFLLFWPQKGFYTHTHVWASASTLTARQVHTLVWSWNFMSWRPAQNPTSDYCWVVCLH